MEDKDIELFDKISLKGYEYETLMNALHVSVFKCLLDVEFTAIWCNNYFFDSTGYTKEEYIEIFNYSIRDYFSSMADEYNKIAEIVMDAFQKGEPGFECVSRMPHKGGTFIWIKVVGTFTNEKHAGYPVLYVVYTDITDVIEQQELSKRLEERSKMLRVALDEAEQANNAKSDFLSRMSHDIRTPLNAIIGMTEIADAHLDNPEKIHDCHKKIALSSQHLVGLINDILDMSKIESGKMTLNNSINSLPELLGNVVAIMQPVIKEKKQTLAVYPYHIRHENVCSDALRLRQIFLNILSNASKFTSEGGRITFEIKEAASIDEGKVLIQFLFTDTGIGMRPEFLGHIFDTFTREQDSRVDKTVGSGLGMAITKKITDIMGGEIKVSSQPGLGSTFEVTLPFETVTAPRHWEKDEVSGLKVLLIDNDECVCKCNVDIFENMGILGECITSGIAAVEKVVKAHDAGQDYNVVILDWKINDLGCRQIVQKIRSKVSSNIPVFITTAYNGEDVEREMQELGISGFLTKPLFCSTLYDGLKEFVFNKGGYQGRIKKEKSFDFTGKKFLMAEDNELNREIAVELLSATGAQIDCVSNGLECIEMFSHSPVHYYDLILMDIQMPVVNGYVATKKIRGLLREDAKNIQIWAMTADAFVEDIEKAKKVGMNGHFAKPLDIVAVNTEISSFLLS